MLLLQSLELAYKADAWVWRDGFLSDTFALLSLNHPNSSQWPIKNPSMILLNLGTLCIAVGVLHIR